MWAAWIRRDDARLAVGVAVLGLAVMHGAVARAQGAQALAAQALAAQAQGTQAKGAQALAAQALAAGDPKRGAAAFAVCRACHQVGPGAHNSVGPVLNGVVGRQAGTYPGFPYSAAMQHCGITWTVPELEAYLDRPQKVVPGNRMPFAGLHDPARADDIIAYLAQFKPGGAGKP